MAHINPRTAWTTLPHPALTTIQKQWLMRAGALTAGLRSFGALKLRVLAEYPSGLPLDEASGLLRPHRSPIWVREVAMSIDDVDCVVARSVTPLIASHGIWQGVRRLQSRPLADILYNDRSIIRSAFEVCQITRLTPIYKICVKVTTEPNSRLLARRSVFWRQNTPLLVAECFLPAFWKLAESHRFNK